MLEKTGVAAHVDELTVLTVVHITMVVVVDRKKSAANPVTDVCQLRAYQLCPTVPSLSASSSSQMASSLVLRSTLPRALAHRSVLRAVVQKRNANTSPPSYEYVPGGPIFKGTANDATTFPPPSRAHGSHHWAFERLLSAALVPMTVAAFATSATNYPILDGLLGLSLIVHSHIGFDSIVVDYLHPRKFPRLGPVATWTLRSATVAALVGIYQFNTNDVGLTELIARVWTA